jgi:phosphatidate cytidylyltransferase
MARALADPAAPPERSPSQPAPGGRRWTDLRSRVISALILAPLALVALWLGGWPWILLVGLGSFVLADEWRRLARNRPGIAFIAAGFLCIIPGMAALIWLRADPVAGRADLLFLVMTVWGSDIGAYALGRIVGGRRLAPSISPGKTWSGAVGGLVCAMLVGLATAGFSPRAMAVAAGLSLAAQAGDLLESAVKRYAGVKDSGTLIPGHGGLLDRLDGILAAAPAAALLALALGPGVTIWH